jgi:hypothetical protein
MNRCTLVRKRVRDCMRFTNPFVVMNEGSLLCHLLGAHRARFGLDDGKPTHRNEVQTDPSDGLPDHRTKELAAVFEAYCCFGQTSGSGSTLDSSQMNKLAKESGLLSIVPAAEIDVLFSKVKTSGARRIDFDQFRALLGLICRESSDFSKVVDQIVEAGFPVINATVMPTLLDLMIARISIKMVSCSRSRRFRACTTS